MKRIIVLLCTIIAAIPSLASAAEIKVGDMGLIPHAFHFDSVDIMNLEYPVGTTCNLIESNAITAIAENDTRVLVRYSKLRGYFKDGDKDKDWRLCSSGVLFFVTKSEFREMRELLKKKIAEQSKRDAALRNDRILAQKLIRK